MIAGLYAFGWVEPLRRFDSKFRHYCGTGRPKTSSPAGNCPIAKTIRNLRKSAAVRNAQQAMTIHHPWLSRTILRAKEAQCGGGLEFLTNF